MPIVNYIFSPPICTLFGSLGGERCRTFQLPVFTICPRTGLMHAYADFRFLFYLFLWRMHDLFQLCYYMYVYHVWSVLFFSLGIFRPQIDWSLSCDNGLDYAS